MENAPKKLKIKLMRPENIIKKNRELYEFEGRFLESFGKPEKFSKWFITGPSFSGKSSLLFIMAKYFVKFGKVDYNNHEEAGGDAETVVKKLKQAGLENERDLRFYKAPIESATHETFLERLSKRGSAAFAILDSMQHAELTRRQYLELTTRLCNVRRGKSLVFVSHWVKNDFTKFVKHDCDVKIEVIGFVARAESRCTGAQGRPFIIWEQGAKAYWGKNYKKVIEGKYWPGIKK